MSSDTHFLKQAIMTFCDNDPNDNPWVNGKPIPEDLSVVPHSSHWKNVYSNEKTRIKNQLKDKAIHIEHVGSTSVPDLIAKPVIDIDLIVKDPSQEQDYIPALDMLGYQLTVREPSWYQHRMLRLNKPRVNLHVFGENCPEHIRHILFRDWLCHHQDDRNNYAQTKLNVIEKTEYVMSYNNNKNQIIKAIYTKIFNELDTLLNIPK